MKSLILCCLLALGLSVLQIFSHIRRFGGPVIRGNREDYPVATGFVGRVPRAHANLLENLLPFAVAVFAVAALGISDRWTAAASLLFTFARIIHAGTYLAGVTIIRSAAFYTGLIATVVMFVKTLL